MAGKLLVFQSVGPEDDLRGAAGEFVPHGHQLFGGGWVDSDCGVKLGFGSAHFKSNSDKLNHFARFRPEYMATKDPAGDAVHDQLHERFFVPPGERVL